MRTLQSVALAVVIALSSCTSDESKPPTSGGARQEQLLLPISIDPGIDRIRIERYSGSAILIDATIFRMGAP